MVKFTIHIVKAVLEPGIVIEGFEGMKQYRTRSERQSISESGPSTKAEKNLLQTVEGFLQHVDEMKMKDEI